MSKLSFIVPNCIFWRAKRFEWTLQPWEVRRQGNTRRGIPSASPSLSVICLYSSHSVLESRCRVVSLCSRHNAAHGVTRNMRLWKISLQVHITPLFEGWDLAQPLGLFPSIKPGMEVHTCNPSRSMVEAEGSILKVILSHIASSLAYSA